MNNKKLGNDFEQEFCDVLAKYGYWVHFISPDKRGSQPFDIIAVKNGVAYAYDCKTSVKQIFPLTRLEENQIMAFGKWLSCGNNMPMVAVKYDGHIYIVPYTDLVTKGKVNLYDYKSIK